MEWAGVALKSDTTRAPSVHTQKCWDYLTYSPPVDLLSVSSDVITRRFIKTTSQWHRGSLLSFFSFFCSIKQPLRSFAGYFLKIKFDAIKCFKRNLFIIAVNSLFPVKFNFFCWCYQKFDGLPSARRWSVGQDTLFRYFNPSNTVFTFKFASEHEMPSCVHT